MRGRPLRLERTSIREQRDHNHNQFCWLAQPFDHGPASRTKGLFARLTAIALPLAIMDDDSALSSLASCATRRVRAKLVRRVHRLCGCLHRHSMPRTVSIFKLFLLFHQLVGALHNFCKTVSIFVALSLKICYNKSINVLPCIIGAVGRQSSPEHPSLSFTPDATCEKRVTHDTDATRFTWNR